MNKTPITLKQLKDGAVLPKPIYEQKPYVVLSPDGVIIAAGDLRTITNLGSYFNDYEVKIREHDLHLNNNARADHAVLTAGRLGYELSDMDVTITDRVMDHISDAAKALALLESLPSFAWEHTCTDWESACADIATAIRDIAPEWKDWTLFVYGLVHKPKATLDSGAIILHNGIELRPVNNRRFEEIPERELQKCLSSVVAAINGGDK